MLKNNKYQYFSININIYYFSRTDSQGYLQGRGELQLGDELVALYPITVTESYTLYHSSAPVSLTGVEMFSVTTPGVQDLVVSANNRQTEKLTHPKNGPHP